MNTTIIANGHIPTFRLLIAKVYIVFGVHYDPLFQNFLFA
jgi:hypothetical protein